MSIYFTFARVFASKLLITLNWDPFQTKLFARYFEHCWDKRTRTQALNSPCRNIPTSSVGRRRSGSVHTMGQRRISLVWTGAEKLRLRFTIPAGREAAPAWWLAKVLVERLGQPHAFEDVTMTRRGGAPLPPDTLCATLADGECVRVSPRPLPKKLCKCGRETRRGTCAVCHSTDDARRYAVAAARAATVETRTSMAGVAIECDLVNEQAPDVTMIVVDALSGRRHAFSYKADQPVRDVKRDLREAEAPRYRFEAHMGSLFLEVDGASKLLDEFGSFSAQGVASGASLRHVVVDPTKQQRTGVDTCPGNYPSY